MISDQIDFLKEKGLLQADQVVISKGSTPVKEHLPTNVIKITKIN